MPPQAALERAERATHRRNRGEKRRLDGDKMQVLLSRPAKTAARVERAKWAERQRAAELCRRTALRLLERSKPLARKTLAAAWLGATFAVQPLRKAAGECDKTSILLRKPQPLEIKSKKLTR